jgi:DNA-binding CsgD family transcriptional regulator
MKPQIFKEALKIWKEVGSQLDEINLQNENEIQSKLLTIFHPGDFYHYIFNIKTICFEFLSPNVVKLLGYELKELDVSFFINLIHPEDQPYFLNFENKVVEFFANLSAIQIANYKISYDYRLMKKDGTYIRILHQAITVKFDTNDKIHKVLGVHTNITHIKKEGVPILSIISLNKEPSYYNIKVEEVFKIDPFQVSVREREIICLLVNGNTSKIIGILLSISKHTVDTHRRNLLNKTNTKNIAELTLLAIKNGWV